MIAQWAKQKGREPVWLEIATDKAMALQMRETTPSSTFQSFEDEVLLPAKSTFIVTSPWTRRASGLVQTGLT